jgi:hypothetical protein
MNWALDGGDWEGSRLGLFTPEEIIPVPTEEEGEWAPDPVRTQRKEKKCVVLLGIEARFLYRQCCWLLILSNTNHITIVTKYVARRFPVALTYRRLISSK